MYNKDALIAQLKQLLIVLRKKTDEVENFLRLVEGEEIVNLQEIKASVTKNLVSQIKNNSLKPEYPMNENLLFKMRHFDEVIDRVWLINEFKEFVKTNENKLADKTLNNLSQRIYYYVNQSQAFVMKYNNSNNYAFYSAHPAWVEKKGKVFKLISSKEPPKELIKGLRPEQKSPEKIIWKGIE